MRENPGRSNRWIAKSLGVNHETVAGVRRMMESTGGFRQLDRTLGADGRYRPTSGGSHRVGCNGEHERLTARSNEAAPEAEARQGAFDLDDEEAIVRAAAEIRQRRVADQLRAIQDRRRANQPLGTR